MEKKIARASTLAFLMLASIIMTATLGSVITVAQAPEVPAYYFSSAEECTVLAQKMDTESLMAIQSTVGPATQKELLKIYCEKHIDFLQEVEAMM